MKNNNKKYKLEKIFGMDHLMLYNLLIHISVMLELVHVEIVIGLHHIIGGI
jgi:hypothetical protein